MRSSTKPLRLNPQAAGELQHKCSVAVTELAYAKRYCQEFDRQLKQLVGSESARQLHEATENALLLADLAKEAA